MEKASNLQVKTTRKTRKISFNAPNKHNSSKNVRKRGVSWARDLCEVKEIDDYMSQRKVPSSKGSESNISSHNSEGLPKSILKNKNCASNPLNMKHKRSSRFKEPDLHPRKAKSKFYQRSSRGKPPKAGGINLVKAQRKTSVEPKRKTRKPKKGFKSSDALIIDGELDDYNNESTQSVSDDEDTNPKEESKKKVDELFMNASSKSKNILEMIFKTDYTSKPTSKTPKLKKGFKLDADHVGERQKKYFKA